MNAVVRISAVVAVVVLTIGACMFAAADFELRSLPRSFESPELAMELARSMEEVKAIVGEPGHSDRSQMRSQQYMDFLFIVAYLSEFLLIGVLLWHRNFSLARLLALLAWLCETLAAGLDVRENVGIVGLAGLWWNALLNRVALLMLFGLFTLVVAVFWNLSRLLHGL